MTGPARPWTRFYPPGTPHDLGPLHYPHIPAAVRDASRTYGPKQAFTLGLPNGAQGGLTFEETDRLSDQFAVYLREVAGFAAGDRIAIQMPNCLAYPVVVFGALKAGLVRGDDGLFRAPAGALQPQAIYDQTVPITLTNQKNVAFGYSSAQATTELDSIRQRYVQPGAEALANAAETAKIVVAEELHVERQRLRRAGIDGHAVSFFSKAPWHA